MRIELLPLIWLCLCSFSLALQDLRATSLEPESFLPDENRAANIDHLMELFRQNPGSPPLGIPEDVLTKAVPDAEEHLGTDSVEVDSPDDDDASLIQTEEPVTDNSETEEQKVAKLLLSGFRSPLAAVADKNQRGYPVSYAIDANIAKTGYAYNAQLPANAMFTLARGGVGQSVHRVLMRWYGGKDHHGTKMKLWYTTATQPSINDETQWVAISFMKFLNKVEGGKIVNDEIQCAGQQLIIVGFTPIICTAIKLTIMDSDAPNHNALLMDFRVAGPRDGNNIALGKPVKQSSMCCGGVAKRAVDGNQASNWGRGSCTATKFQKQPWLSINLNAKYDIDMVRLVNRWDCCWNRLNGVKTMITQSVPNMEKILPSTVCAATGRNYKRGEHVFVNCEGREGDHVTVFLAGTGLLTVCEIEVYPRLEINVARGLGWDPLITDGIITPHPSFNVGTGPQSLTLDLRAVFSVSRVVVRRVFDDSRTYKNEVYQHSQRGRWWSTFYNTDHTNKMGQGIGGDQPAVTSQQGVVVALAEKNARYFRFWSNGSDKSSDNEYTEIEVFVRSGSRDGAGSCGPIGRHATRTASSSWNAQHGPQCSELFSTNKPGCYSDSWSARGYTNKEYIQLAFPSLTTIYAVATQGRSRSPQWATKYQLRYFDLQLNSWRWVDPILDGNSDMDSVVMHTLAKTLVTDKIRFYVQGYYGHPSMRVDVYGCMGTAENVALAHATATSSIAQARVPVRAVDGKVGTDAANDCTLSNREVKPWWRVDMGMSFEVDHVVVLNVADEKQASALKSIMAAVTPGSYDKVVDIPSSFNCKALGYELPPSEYGWIDCLGRRGRYVYLFLTASTEEELSLCEVSVYPRADRDMMLGTTSASTLLSDYAVNKKAGNYNVGGGVKKLDLDLGFTTLISAINIRHNCETKRVYRGVVAQISIDNKKWTTVYSNDGGDLTGTGIGLEQTYTEVPEGKNILLWDTPAARYVRLWSGGSSHDQQNEYVEVEVLGGRVAIPDLRGPVSMESYNVKGRFWQHTNFLGFLKSASAGVSEAAKASSFIVVKGLTGRGVSFQSNNFPNRYLRHQGYLIKLHPKESSGLFKKDATFLPRPGLAGAAHGFLSFESVNFPGHFIVHDATTGRLKLLKVSDSKDQNAAFRPTFSLAPAAGADGARGPTGAEGKRGQAGIPGPKGEKGPVGPLGPQGPRGRRGVDAVLTKELTGAKGDPGRAGNSGLTGEKGPPGKKGPIGKKGSTGETGPKGDPGKPGKPGKRGKVGSNGPPGKPGSPGQQGPRGPPGFEGPKGAKGQQGNIGEPGDPGSDGPDGDQGDPGPPGVAGDPAVKGPKGKQGPDGLTGPAGPPGHKGPHGKPGSRGPQGEFGPPGPPGKPGDGAASRAEEQILSGLERQISEIEKKLTAQTDKVTVIQKENVKMEGLARKALAEAQAKVASEDSERAKKAAEMAAVATARAAASKPKPKKPAAPAAPAPLDHGLSGKVMTLGPENYI